MTGEVARRPPDVARGHRLPPRQAAQQSPHRAPPARLPGHDGSRDTHHDQPQLAPRHLRHSQRLLQQARARPSHDFVVSPGSDWDVCPAENVAGVGEHGRCEHAPREHECPDQWARACQHQDFRRTSRAAEVHSRLAFDHEAAGNKRVDQTGKGGLGSAQLFGQGRAREGRGPAQRLEHFALARPKTLAPRFARAFPSIAHCDQSSRIRASSLKYEILRYLKTLLLG